MMNNQPINGQTVASRRVETCQPVNGQPVNDQPVNDQPVNGQPVNGQPVNDQPVNNSQAVTSPAINWQSQVAFWLARTVNPPVRPQKLFHCDREKLRQLPDGTLGRELVKFLDHHGFELPQTGDWIQQTHDIWHILTGLSPSPEDEFILQAFVRAQVFRPSSAIIVLLGLCTGQLSLKALCRSLRLGRVAQNIAQWDIETDWETPLSEIRQRLGIHPHGITRQTKGF